MPPPPRTRVTLILWVLQLCIIFVAAYIANSFFVQIEEFNIALDELAERVNSTPKYPKYSPDEIFRDVLLILIQVIRGYPGYIVSFGTATFLYSVGILFVYCKMMYKARQDRIIEEHIKKANKRVEANMRPSRGRQWNRRRRR